MNRQERRLAARLGVVWVKQHPGGSVELCLGGPGCGCGGPGGPEERTARSAEHRTTDEAPAPPVGRHSAFWTA